MIIKYIKSNEKLYNFYLINFYDAYHEIIDTIIWIKNFLNPPVPNWKKHLVIRKFAIKNSILIETGTFTGYTLLKNEQKFKKIFSFEPSKKFYSLSKTRLENISKIKIFNNISEKGLPKLLKNVGGDVTFWLDGHYSGNETFKGPNKVPIKYELQAIIKHKKNLKRFVILIDDLRLFGKKPYPSKKFLINFCKINKLKFYICSDIFIIVNY